ncbi:MAG: DNA-binding protein [bacterium]
MKSLSQRVIFRAGEGTKNNFREKAHHLFFFLFALMIVLSPCISQGRLLSSDTLINQSNRLDGQTVQFRGEVVGDIMDRGAYCWINVNDGSQALGIYCPTSMVKSIRFIGDYKQNGDTVEVSGIFHKACKQHGGELDIHAESLKIIQTGTKRKHPVAESKLYLAISSFFCTILTFSLHIYRKKNRSWISS